MIDSKIRYDYRRARKASEAVFRHEARRAIRKSIQKREGEIKRRSSVKLAVLLFAVLLVGFFIGVIVA